MEIRREGEPVIIWADALCINQSDDGEKTSQVGLMRDIYRDAKEVIAWLGYPPEREVFSDETTDDLLDAVEAAVEMNSALMPEINILLESFGPFNPRFNAQSPVILGLFRLDPEAAKTMAERSPLAKKKWFYGHSIHKGILPRDVCDYVPLELFSSESQQIYTSVLRIIHFGPRDLATGDPRELDPVIKRLSDHIRLIEQIEDRLLARSIVPIGDEERLDWDSEGNSALLNFFLNAYTKAELPRDYHVVGAFCILATLSMDIHIHELPFFAEEDRQDPNHLAWYPSMFWRHSLNALITMMRLPYWNRVVSGVSC
jgi:hypothetical protein